MYASLKLSSSDSLLGDGYWRVFFGFMLAYLIISYYLAGFGVRKRFEVDE